MRTVKYLVVLLIAVVAAAPVSFTSHQALAQGGASVTGPEIVPVDSCRWDVFFNLSGFAPNSMITVSNDYAQTTCEGHYVDSAWTATAGPTDSNGNLRVGYIHGGPGPQSHNFTFSDNQGNSVSVSFTYNGGGPSEPSDDGGDTPPPADNDGGEENEPPPPQPSGPAASLGANPNQVSPGQSVTVNWSQFSPTGNDWVSLHPVDTPDSSVMDWQHIDGTDGSRSFNAPSQPGWYHFRLFRNGEKVATSNAFQVTGSGVEDNVSPPLPTADGGGESTTSNNWGRGNTVGLCLGTEIRVGSGLSYQVHTVVPENNWPVTVIDGPRAQDDYTWWDISRAGGGTGWVRQDQADCGAAGPSVQPEPVVPETPTRVYPGWDIPWEAGGFDFALVTIDNLRIRDCAGTACLILGYVVKGDYYPVLNRQGDWGAVVTIDELEGWIYLPGYTELVSAVNPPDSVSPNENPVTSEATQDNQSGQAGTIELTIDGTYRLEIDPQRCFLLNGADVIFTEMNREWSVISSKSSDAEKLAELFNYLKPTAGPVRGDVEWLRANIENAVTSLNAECTGNVQYVVGDMTRGVRFIDTSGLGNIAYGYYFEKLGVANWKQNVVADMDQYVKSPEFQRALQLCGPDLPCIAASFLIASDEPDDKQQRLVGERMAESGLPLSTDLLIRYANTYGLY